ncbi:hypothetical protein [Yersinia ruckeri]|uniref:hypothetical protein n=1 Tax=Yersinia ruckeri TaxID=29486 RepID=UPI0022379324|nr:hypothetical protein [Yersinia ruckeri]MCW6598801.1 hypothetical protein [Yersinia ruckeri]
MIKNIFKMQPRLQEIADNLVFVHPKVQRQSCGWEVAGNFIPDSAHGDWKASLKFSHHLLAKADSIYDINVLNCMLDLPVKPHEVDGQQIVIFPNIYRRNHRNGSPYWQVERRIKGFRYSKQFADVRYNNSWEKSLQAATIYLLTELKIYSCVESELEYPKTTAFLFKTGQIRLGLVTSNRAIVRYVPAKDLTQASLDSAITELYAEWVWYQAMINKFGEKDAKRINKPDKLTHWYRDDFPLVPVADILKRVKH